MVAPSIEDLTSALGTYVGQAAAGNQYVQSCTKEAVAFIGQRFDRTLINPLGEGEIDYAQFIAAGVEKMPTPAYVREVMELGADLFYRRQAQNGIVSVNAMDGTVARVSRDPWAAAEQRLARWLGLGFA